MVQIPDQVYSLDGKRFIAVSLDQMRVPSDERGDLTMHLSEKLASFSSMTRTAASFILLQALNGKRKSSTVLRWLNELSLFSRTASAELGHQLISVITLQMYLWYCSKKGASQEKLLRGALLWWSKEGAPGIHPDLIAHIAVTAPRKPRGMIEVQNAEPSERPLTMQQVHELLDDVADLYLSGKFSPQDNLLWRLMISEALRPAQMRLLQFGDIQVIREADGRLKSVRLNVPLVKQSGVPARDYMRWHRLSSSLSQAVIDHLEFVRGLLGSKPSSNGALFCVRKTVREMTYTAGQTSVQLHHLIKTTRELIASLNQGFASTDLFSRRFKHTKLTHLAAAGAPIEVLAYAGFQTSTVSLSRYVNLTEEAFAGHELRLEQSNQHIESAFRGKLIQRSEATHRDPEHRIKDPSMEGDVGACSAEPCEALACLACYGCHRFEAFIDGPHDRVEAMLVAEQERARAAGMPPDAIYLKDRTVAQVRRVMQLIKA